MDLLRGKALTLGIKLAAEEAQAFSVYYHELVAWNARFNLTAITEEEAVYTRHFLDSLTVLTAIAPRSADGSIDTRAFSARVIDVGTGAGFPGLALRIVCPNLRLTLVDSVGKKATFLHHMVETLGLTGVEIQTARAEDLARERDHRDAYDFAVARALAPLPVLLEYCLPFVRPGGMLVAQKKGELADEVAASAAALRALNGRLLPAVDVPEEVLPDRRVLVLVRKTAATPAQFPRRAGLAAKRPIGGSKS